MQCCIRSPISLGDASGAFSTNAGNVVTLVERRINYVVSPLTQQCKSVYKGEIGQEREREEKGGEREMELYIMV